MQECSDLRCAAHGQIKTHGNIFSGEVISTKADKTVTIQRSVTHYVPKYERYKKVRSKIAAHKPPCIDVFVGDIVRIEETRKLSKTKNFVVTKVLKRAKK
ncbi:MAG: 30S ribosomal protein S17 [Candidatus Diapherotrites archaeon]|nr:30S ribosomal protein S17 [Candidatus Diapherotrites archaeon]